MWMARLSCASAKATSRVHTALSASCAARPEVKAAVKPAVKAAVKPEVKA